MRADGLFVAANHTHAGGGMLALAQRVNGRNTLPGGRRRKALAQDCSRRQTRAGPILPRLLFLGVNVGQVLDSVAQQMARNSRGQLRSHPLRCMRALFFAGKQMRFANAVKSNRRRGVTLAPQVNRSSPVAE